MLYKKNPNMEFIESDDAGLVVFDPETGDTSIIDEFGAAIFRALGAESTCEAIAVQLAAQYQAEPGEIEADVQEFLNDLVAERILISCE